MLNRESPSWKASLTRVSGNETGSMGWGPSWRTQPHSPWARHRRDLVARLHTQARLHVGFTTKNPTSGLVLFGGNPSTLLSTRYSSLGLLAVELAMKHFEKGVLSLLRKHRGHPNYVHLGTFPVSEPLGRDQDGPGETGTYPEPPPTPARPADCRTDRKQRPDLRWEELTTTGAPSSLLSWNFWETQEARSRRHPGRSEVSSASTPRLSSCPERGQASSSHRTLPPHTVRLCSVMGGPVQEGCTLLTPFKPDTGRDDASSGRPPSLPAGSSILKCFCQTRPHVWRESQRLTTMDGW